MHLIKQPASVAVAAIAVTWKKRAGSETIVDSSAAELVRDTKSKKSKKLLSALLRGLLMQVLLDLEMALSNTSG